MLRSDVLLCIQLTADFVLPFVQDRFTERENYDYFTMLCFGCIILLNNWLHNEFEKTTRRESLFKNLKFSENAWNRYSDLSQPDREGEDVSVFKEILKGKEDAVRMRNNRFRWSYKTAFSMVISLISSILVLRSILPLVYVILFYSMFYKHIQVQMEIIGEMRKVLRKAHQNNNKLNNYESSKIRIGQGDVAKIVERKRVHNILLNEFEHEWIKLSTMCSIPIIMACIASLFSFESQPINIIMLCTKLLKSIGQITGFLSAYEDTIAKEKLYDTFWEGKNPTPLPKQYRMDILTIHKYCFKGMCTIFNQIPKIFPGDIIRLVGETGCGKTTFVNALKGVIDGLVLDSIYHPLNHFNHIVHLRQDIRDSTPFIKVSICDLFGGISRDKIIEVLIIVGLEEWFYEVMNGNIYGDIANSISGGQRTLFCTAVVLIEASSLNTQLLILDEPEQGLDTELIPEFLTNILEWLHMENPELRIIFISHLCDCVVEQLPENICWTLKIEDGQSSLFI